MNLVTTEDIIQDIRKVAQKLKCKKLGRADYYDKGKYSHYQVYEEGRNWEDLCKAAGVKTKKKEPVSDEEYFQRLKAAIKDLRFKRFPRSNERKKYGLNFSKSRYPTLEEFIIKALKLGVIELPKSEKKYKLLLENQDNMATQHSVQLHLKSETSNIQTEGVPPIPSRTRRTKWERTGIYGFPYAPQDESGVVSLFGILCATKKIPWQIIELNSGKGIDATCHDHTTNREIKVELKYKLSKASWNHKKKDLDYVVCWINSWKDFGKPVIELSKLIKKT